MYIAWNNFLHTYHNRNEGLIIMKVINSYGWSSYIWSSIYIYIQTQLYSTKVIIYMLFLYPLLNVFDTPS
jgi:hypothetical protein